MTYNKDNVLLHTDNLEERVMKATGLTKNLVCKMLCDANETEDEAEKAKILSHFIWHMPAGQLANTDSAKSIKKTLIEDLAKEIGTEVPDDIMSSLTIEVKEDKPVEESVEKPVEEPIEESVEKPAEEPAEEPAEKPTEEPVDDIVADQTEADKEVSEDA